jgi:hypothetical protein
LWPQVELPLGATEDRICGTIDIEKALTEGVKAFEPGLLVSDKERSNRHMTDASPCVSPAARLVAGVFGHLETGM